MKQIILIAALAGLALLACPAWAAINDIPAGGEVFLGEQGLDITAGVGANNEIAWFPSTAQLNAATPEKIIDVSTTKTNFYINPTEFASRTGNWYSWAPGLTVGTTTLAFRVTEPRLDIRVDDMGAGVEVTNKWLYTGDEVQFRIITNLHTIGQRALVAGAGAPITIKFETPEGAVLTALVNKAGVTTQLVDIPVKTSPYATGRIWDSTGGKGTYKVWAECNANGMHDNYGVQSPTVTFLEQERNPIIVVNTQTTKATTTTAPVPSATTPAPTPKPTTAATTAGTTATVPAPSAETTVQPPATATTRADGFSFSVAVLGCFAAIAIAGGRRR